ncbi:MAG: N-acetyl-alpha-D-glucosaminyl L-malate synthase BshA [Firmicutes bacterium]|nr:N-acetyl-alpha-D-glucosaminyl L-malate synthase BshA [Bacillota bacterium]
MKIGMLCYWNYGGSAAVASELGKALAERGHQIHYISTETPFRLEQYHPNIFLHQPGNVHYPVFSHPPFFLLELNKVIETVQAHQLDLLHAHYAIPHCLNAIMARQVLNEQIPVLTTLHGTDITLVGQHKEFYQLTKYGLGKSNQITAVSQSLAQEAADVFSLHKTPEVIYNFINPNKFYRRFNEPLYQKYASEGEKILIHVSNFRPVKRVTDVVEVFYQVNKKVPSRLLLIGDGPEMVNVQERVRGLQLVDRVYFLGQQEDIVSLLSIADLMLLPSARESFGLVAVEAMACGVPVVASNTGGVPEVIPHGQVGYLTDIGDVVAMARYAEKILTDNKLHRQFSVSARKWVTKKFSSEFWVNKYEEIYSSLIPGRK